MVDDLRLLDWSRQVSQTFRRWETLVFPHVHSLLSVCLSKLLRVSFRQRESRPSSRSFGSRGYSLPTLIGLGPGPVHDPDLLLLAQVGGELVEVDVGLSDEGCQPFFHGALPLAGGVELPTVVLEGLRPISLLQIIGGMHRPRFSLNVPGHSCIAEAVDLLDLGMVGFEVVLGLLCG